MSWKPIVVGVDPSPEAAGAAALGWRMAQATGTRCHLVHATRDVWSDFAAAQLPERAAEFERTLIELARQQVGHALRGSVPAGLLEQMRVRLGPPPVVLRQAAAELGAGLVVLGGKHHSALGRWLAGSTSLNVVRTADAPVLVTAGVPTAIRRVMVAVDLSTAAGPTIEHAERYAALFGAELRALSVLEPLPVIPEIPLPTETADYYAAAQEHLQREIWPLIQSAAVEKLVRHGSAVETILREATEWPADLLVVGSHGRGWAERVLVGSVTERLLNHLPTSLLVVPVVALRQPEEPAQGKRPRRKSKVGART